MFSFFSFLLYSPLLRVPIFIVTCAYLESMHSIFREHALVPWTLCRQASSPSIFWWKCFTNESFGLYYWLNGITPVKVSLSMHDWWKQLDLHIFQVLSVVAFDLPIYGCLSLVALMMDYKGRGLADNIICWIRMEWTKYFFVWEVHVM